MSQSLTWSQGWCEGEEEEEEEEEEVCIIKGVSNATASRISKSQKISKKSLTNLIVISRSLKPVKISYANGRVSVRIFYKK